MKKMIVCSIAMLTALAIGGQTVFAQCGGNSCKKPKTETPAPAPAPAPVDPAQ